MGFGVRVHVFEDDGSVTRIPYARYQRLTADGSRVRMREYAGKRVRCAVTFVEFRERRPVRIVRTDFQILAFAADGAVDRDEYDRAARLAVNSVAIGLGEGVADLVPRISRKRYREEFTWVPTQEHVAAIVNDVFPSGDR